MKNKAKIIITNTLFLSLILSTNIYLFTLKNDRNALSEVVSTTINEDKIAYLTFDDGPSANTNKILEILDQYNIKATFFVVGPSYKLKNDLLIKIVQSGHELGIHSYQHNYSYIYASKENYLKDFYACAEWIKKITGKSPTIYRFPGGSSNTIASEKLIKSIINELKEKGYTHADWNVDTLDSYAKSDPNKVIKNTITSLKKNENNKHFYQTILIHDDINKQASIQALPQLIEKLISYNYQFKPLTQNSHIIKHTI